MHTPLSVVIITRNEAHNLGPTLSAAQQVADELLVADSGSTDGTQALALASGSRVIQVPWQGYAATKNAANQQAVNDWILSLDADEVLDHDLIAAINQKKAKHTADAYELVRHPYYCGKRIRHSGWNPDTKVRFFQKQRAEWRGAFVHETLHLPQRTQIERLPGAMRHYTVHRIEDHVAQVRKFSRLKAEELYQRGKRPSKVGLRLKPGFQFWRDYVLKGGFRDGWRGFVICRMNATSKFLRYAQLKELWEENNPSAPAANSETSAP